MKTERACVTNMFMFLNYIWIMCGTVIGRRQSKKTFKFFFEECFIKFNCEDIRDTNTKQLRSTTVGGICAG